MSYTDPHGLVDQEGRPQRPTTAARRTLGGRTNKGSAAHGRGRRSCRGVAKWPDDERDVPIEPINALAVQAIGVGFVLTVGQATPPAKLAGVTPEEAKKLLKERPVEISGLRKFLLVPDIAQELLNALKRATEGGP